MDGLLQELHPKLTVWEIHGNCHMFGHFAKCHRSHAFDVTACILHFGQSKDIAACQSAYKEVDLDGNGALDIDEIGEMFKVLGMHMESHTLQALFDKYASALVENVVVVLMPCHKL